MIAAITTKKCSTCGVLKPIENFSKRVKSEDGFRSQCKCCRSKKQHERYAGNSSFFLEQMRLYNKAHPEKRRERYKKNKKYYYNYCKEYRRKHKEHLSLWWKNYYQKHKKLFLEKKHVSYKNNPKPNRERAREWRLKNPGKSHANTRDWRKKNPDKVLRLSRVYVERRRAKLYNASGWNYTNEQHIKWRWEMWGNRCWMCGNEAEATDHFIPLEKNGSHYPANLRPACTHCNSSKGSKILKINRRSKPNVWM